MKPVKAWAVVTKKGSFEFHDVVQGALAVHRTRKSANENRVTEWNERVIHVLITPIEKRRK